MTQCYICSGIVINNICVDCHEPQSTRYRYVGSRHPFYTYGDVYYLVMWRTFWHRWRVEVQHGRGMPFAHSQQSYRNIAAFERDFKEVR